MKSNHFLKKAYVSIVSQFYKKDKNLWLFGEWFGNKCCDNSLYLANYIAQNHKGIKLVWAANKNADLSLLDKRVKVIDREASSSIKVYKKAGVVLMNQGIADFADDPYNYFSGAITVNLWHGVPWKKIFLDSSKNSSFVGKIVDRIAMSLTRSKYYLALSDNFANIIKRSTKVKDKAIIRTGYPRNSIFYDANQMREAKKRIVDQIKKNGGKVSGNTRIIAYMPTFRDSGSKTFSFNDVDDSFYDYLSFNDIIVVEKCHYADVNKSAVQSNGVVINMPDCNAQELLAASDILITDYSSCFFDYLVLDRPIIHYIYDYDYYSTKDRGVYYDKNDVVCGDTPDTPEALIESIKNNLDYPMNNKELRQKRRKKYITYESYDSCKIIYEFIKDKLK